MFRTLTVCVSLLAMIGGETQAAVLQVEGLASVDAGKGYAPATSNTQVNPGDRVRAAKGCTLIVYSTGYKSKICNGQLAVVVSDPPSPAPGRALSLKDKPEPAPEQFDTTDLALPGLLVGGGVGLAIALSNNHSSPNSP